jgi:uncharacterized protein (DUF305 family)
VNTKIKTLPIAAALAASLGLAGCAADSGNPGSNGMHGTAHASSSPMTGMMSDAAAEHNQADIMFAQMMIPHHAQAVEMSDIVLAKPGLPAEITALATKIKDAQAPEIETMTGWLKTWNAPGTAWPAWWTTTVSKSSRPRRERTPSGSSWSR